MFNLVFDKDFGSTNAGDVIHTEDETLAQSLISAGYAHEATEEELNGTGESEEVAEETTPEVVTNAVEGLAKNAQKAVTEATAKAVKTILANQPKAKAPVVNSTVAATPVDRKSGFPTFGHFAKCVHSAELGDISAKRKIAGINAQFKGQMNETTSADGGALVPVEYAQNLFEKVWNQTALLNSCTRYPMKHKTLEIPAVNETAASQGIVAYWVDEAAQITDSKGKFTQIELSLKKLAVLCNVTDELLDDNAYALEAHLNQYVPKKMLFALNQSILDGTNSQANIIGGASTVAVGRRHANHINVRDINRMYGRMWTDSIGNACWFITPGAISELLGMAFPDFNGSVPAYMPNNGSGYPGMQFAPSGLLLGRPVYPIENCPAVGTTGDIIFADMSQCAAGYKEVAGAASIHLYFDKAISSFRYILRVSTKSLWTAAYTRADGTTASPFVVLDSNGDSSQSA